MSRRLGPGTLVFILLSLSCRPAAAHGFNCAEVQRLCVERHFCLLRGLMECVVNEAFPRGAQREENQAGAAVSGTTDGDPGERYTSALDSFFFKKVFAAVAVSYQTETGTFIIR